MACARNYSEGRFVGKLLVDDGESPFACAYFGRKVPCLNGAFFHQREEHSAGSDATQFEMRETLNDKTQNVAERYKPLGIYSARRRTRVIEVVTALKDREFL